MADTKKKKSGGNAWIVLAIAGIAGAHYVKSLNEPEPTPPPAPPPAVNADCLETLTEPSGTSPYDRGRAYLRVMMRDQDKADDLAIDALLRVCAKDPSGDLAAYYFGALKRMQANPFRKEIREVRKREAYSRTACPRETTDPLDAIASDEMRELLTRWLKDLSEDELDILNQHVIRQRSFRDISDETGIPRQTLSDRYQRVKAKLLVGGAACEIVERFGLSGTQ